MKFSPHFGSFNKTGEIYDIIFDRLLDHSVQEVWAAITRPEQLAQWLGPGSIELKEGGAVRIRMQDMDIRGTVIQLKPESLLEYTWTSTSFPGEVSVLRWELTAEADGKCRLVFRERLVSPVYLSGAGAGWHHIMDTLSDALDGKTIPPFSPEVWQQASQGITEKYKEILEKISAGENAAPQPEAKAEMLIRKPAEAVYEAMVNPEITSRFWFTKGSGRLDAGKKVIWEWEMYGVKEEIFAHEIVPNRLISFVWGTATKATNVTMTFTPKGPDATYFSVVEKGWDKDDQGVIPTIVGQTEGWTIVLAGLKAYLEHGVQLRLVEDKFPDQQVPA